VETAIDPAPLELFENEMNEALTIPGVANSFTMPIKARIDMLATGIRTPVGIKVLGPKLNEIEKIGLAIEHHMKKIPGTRSSYAERITTGYFLNFAIRRDAVARYGLTVEDVQDVIQSAIGGMTDHHGGRKTALPGKHTLFEGIKRYPEKTAKSTDPGYEGGMLLQVQECHLFLPQLLFRCRSANWQR